MGRVYKRALGARNYINYDPKQLERAVRDVRGGQLTVRQASDRYSIPKSTIHDKIKGTHTKTHGGQTVLSQEEEGQFVEAVLVSAEWGFPLTEFDIRQIVQQYVTRQGRRVRQWKNNLPGTTWAKMFLSRHKVLTTRLTQNIKRSRAQVTDATINEYFLELQKSMEGVPAQNIVNYDETNFSDDPGKPKVVCKRGSKHCDRIIDSSKTNISVMMAASASGELLPPFVVYKAKHRYEEWEQDGPPGSRYSISKSGWFESTTFVEWFRQIAMPYFRHKEGNKILIGDNLSSHITLDVIQECQRHDIKFILLPPNSTHLCQPLDVAYFAPLKKHWRSILTEWKMKRKGPFQKSDFPRLLQQALVSMNATSSQNILSGFRACGIFPYNPEAVLKRLPRRTNLPVENTPTQSSSPSMGSHVSDTLLDFLQKTRSPDVRPKTRRKRINVKPGQPILPEDVPQKDDPKQSDPGLKKTSKKDINEDHNSSDSDFIPTRPLKLTITKRKTDSNLTKRKTDNLTKRKTDNLSSDSEDESNLTKRKTDNLSYDSEDEVPLLLLKNKKTNQNTDTCDNSVPEVGKFALIRVPLAYCSRYKYYIGLIVEDLREPNATSPYLVRYMRKKKGNDDQIFFYFPRIDDESIVLVSDIVKILDPVRLRRDRYLFSNLPDEITLE